MTDMSDLVRGRGWNFTYWKDLLIIVSFIHSTFVKNINESFNSINHLEDDYKVGVFSYLGILIDRLCDYNSMFCRWANNREEIKNVYSRQAIPMIFDYAETNMFSGKMGSAKIIYNGLLGTLKVNQTIVLIHNVIILQVVINISFQKLFDSCNYRSSIL